MVFPTTGLVVTIEAAFGADRTADPASWVWTDLTDRWHVPDGLFIFHGRGEGARQAEAADITFTLKNVDGQLTPEDPRSQWWPHVDEGLPLRITLDPELPGGETLQFGGFVAKITPGWPGGSALQALVGIVAGGMIRQHARGTSPLRSSLERFLAASGPLGLWPLDDPDGSRQSRAVIGSPMVPAPAPPPLTQSSLPAYGQGDVAPWLPRGIKGQTETGSIRAPLGGGATGGWVADLMYRADQSTVDSPPIGTSIIVHAGDLEFRVAWGADDGIFGTIVLDAAGAIVASDVDTDNSPLLDGQPHHIRWEALDTTGDNTSFAIYVDGVVEYQGTVDIGVAVTPAPGAVGLAWNGEVAATTPVQFNGLAIWNFAGAPVLAAAVDAAFGHTGEPAAIRAQRVCAEEGVTLTVVGDPADSEPMGPQQPGTLLELLRECEAADDGILAEHQFSFWLRTRTSRYNQDPALVVDAAQRQLGRAFEPKRDDQRTRNEWTLTQVGGNAQVTVRDAVDQQRRGVKDDQLDVNVASAARLVDRASWELSRSTIRQLRYPTLTVHLHSSPALLAQVMATRLGDRVQVINPPQQHPPGPVDQVAEGILHTISGRRKWTWSAVVSPYAPWQVGVYADDSETPDAPQRYDTAGSQTVGAFQAGTDTELTVGTTLGQLWTVDPANLPFDVRCGGAQLRVTDVADLPPQIADVTFASSEAATATFTVPAPAGPLAGHVLLLFQATDVGDLAAMAAPTGGGTAWALLAEQLAAASSTAAKVWWKVAGPAEPATYTVHQVANADGVASCVALADGYGITPAAAVASATGAATTVTTPATTPRDLRGQASGSRELRWAALRAVGEPSSWTPPGGFTLEGEGESRGFVGAALASRGLASGGSTGAHDFTITTGFSPMDPVGVTVNVFPTRQTLTVSQATINGVPKTIPDGSDLSLWTPARYAL